MTVVDSLMSRIGALQSKAYLKPAEVSAPLGSLGAVRESAKLVP